MSPDGLAVWFLLWVQEVPGSIPGRDPFAFPTHSLHTQLTFCSLANDWYTPVADKHHFDFYEDTFLFAWYTFLFLTNALNCVKWLSMMTQEMSFYHEWKMQNAEKTIISERSNLMDVLGVYCVWPLQKVVSRLFLHIQGFSCLVSCVFEEWKIDVTVSLWCFHEDVCYFAWSHYCIFCK